MIKSKVADGGLHGIKITPSASEISHLLFAYYTIILTRATTNEASTLKFILKEWKTLFGIRINFDKSKLSLSQNVPSVCVIELEQLIGVKAVERHEKYLPIFVGRTKTQVFSFVQDRIWKKLKGWKEKALSRAGTEVLIKSIIHAIPTFVMGLFLLPTTLCSHIEKMVNRFY